MTSPENTIENKQDKTLEKTTDKNLEKPQQDKIQERIKDKTIDKETEDKEQMKASPTLDNLNFKNTLSFDYRHPMNSRLTDPSYYSQIVKGKPVLIVDLPEYGRSLVAAKDFKKGELIIIDKPFISCTLNDRACDYCLKMTRHRKRVNCLHCGEETYCDKTCADYAWKAYHQSLCGGPSRKLKAEGQKGNGDSAKISLLIYKLFGKMRQMPGWPFQFWKIPFLESLAVPVFQEKYPLQYDLWNLYLILRQCLRLRENERFEFQTYLELYFKLTNNCYQIKYLIEDPEIKLSGSGVGVFPIISFANHNCVPNTKWVTDGAKTGDSLILTATQIITKGISM